jgi:hypothetical protein
MVMKRKSLIMVLCLAVVLATSLPAMATSWTPYYTLSTPSTPPGGSGWTVLEEGNFVWVNPGSSVWIGALNIYQDNALKTGNIRVGYETQAPPVFPAHLWAEGFAVGGQPGPRPASWDDPSKTYISSWGSYMWIGDPPPFGFYAGDIGALLNFFPQPGWEWVRFANLSSGQVGVDSAFIDTTCTQVPLPGSLVLLGSSLLGLAFSYRRLKS